MKISVALTTFNGARFLSDQLQSILNQTVRPDQVVICDDRSSDSTVEIANSFVQKTDVRVDVYVNEINLGVNKNFEKAVRLCDQDTDLILFCDQDDIWDPRKVELTAKTFKATSAPKLMLVIHDCTLCNSEMTIILDSLLENIQIDKGSSKDFVHGCCTSIGRDLRDLLFPIPAEVEPIGYDEWMHVAAEMLGARLVQVDKLLNYRRHEKNVSNSTSYSGNVKIYSKFKKYWNLLAGISNKKPSLDWLRKRLAMVVVLKKRLKLLEGVNQAYGSSYARLLEVEATIHKRMLIRNSFFPVGVMRAAFLYVSGGYVFYSGYKSMMADILRR